MLNVLSNTAQSKIELAGLFAGVGYSDVLIGSTRFTFKDAYSLARRKISSAKPCHVVTPLPQ
jgi:hypothetical protein